MIQLIVGNKGKGKTTQLLNKVNEDIKQVAGNIVYLDKNSKHMYELNNKIRLINVTEYGMNNADEFVGFIMGIISQDHDLQEICLDNFLTLTNLEDKDYSVVLNKIRSISEAYNIRIVISLSVSGDELAADFKNDVIISL